MFKGNLLLFLCASVFPGKFKKAFLPLLCSLALSSLIPLKGMLQRPVPVNIGFPPTPAPSLQVLKIPASAEWCFVCIFCSLHGLKGKGLKPRSGRGQKRGYRQGLSILLLAWVFLPWVKCVNVSPGYSSGWGEHSQRSANASLCIIQGSLRLNRSHIPWGMQGEPPAPCPCCPWQRMHFQPPARRAALIFNNQQAPLMIPVVVRAGSGLLLAASNFQSYYWGKLWSCYPMCALSHPLPSPITFVKDQIRRLVWRAELCKSDPKSLSPSRRLFFCFLAHPSSIPLSHLQTSVLETCCKVAIKIRPDSGEDGPRSVFQMMLLMPSLSLNQSGFAIETLYWELAMVGE